MAKARNYFAWQFRVAAPYLGDRVIEVGCGAGNFTGLLMNRPLVVAVDPEPECIRRVAKRYSNQSNLILECGGPPDPAFLELRRFRPDTCVCFNVIEHIGDDGEALRAMASILEPGGKVLLLAPAFEALYGPIDYALGHYRRYTRRTLSQVAQRAGLEVIKARYMNLPGFFGWWANARIFRRTIQSPAQIALFDRFMVPVVSRIEAMVPPPAGQSVFTVLRKPARGYPCT